MSAFGPQLFCGTFSPHEVLLDTGILQKQNLCDVFEEMKETGAFESKWGGRAGGGNGNGGAMGSGYNVVIPCDSATPDFSLVQVLKSGDSDLKSLLVVELFPDYALRSSGARSNRFGESCFYATDAMHRSTDEGEQHGGFRSWFMGGSEKSLVWTNSGFNNNGGLEFSEEGSGSAFGGGGSGLRHSIAIQHLRDRKTDVWLFQDINTGLYQIRRLSIFAVPNRAPFVGVVYGPRNAVSTKETLSVLRRFNQYIHADELDHLQEFLANGFGVPIAVAADSKAAIVSMARIQVVGYTPPALLGVGNSVSPCQGTEIAYFYPSSKHALDPRRVVQLFSEAQNSNLSSKQSSRLYAMAVFLPAPHESTRRSTLDSITSILAGPAPPLLKTLIINGELSASEYLELLEATGRAGLHAFQHLNSGEAVQLTPAQLSRVVHLTRIYPKLQLTEHTDIYRSIRRFTNSELETLVENRKLPQVVRQPSEIPVGSVGLTVRYNALVSCPIDLVRRFSLLLRDAIDDDTTAQLKSESREPQDCAIVVDTPHPISTDALHIGVAFLVEVLAVHDTGEKAAPPPPTPFGAPAVVATTDSSEADSSDVPTLPPHYRDFYDKYILGPLRLAELADEVSGCSTLLTLSDRVTNLMMLLSQLLELGVYLHIPALKGFVRSIILELHFQDVFSALLEEEGAGTTVSQKAKKEVFVAEGRRRLKFPTPTTAEGVVTEFSFAESAPMEATEGARAAGGGGFRFKKSTPTDSEAPGKKFSSGGAWCGGGGPSGAAGGSSKPSGFVFGGNRSGGDTRPSGFSYSSASSSGGGFGGGDTRPSGFGSSGASSSGGGFGSK